MNSLRLHNATEILLSLCIVVIFISKVEAENVKNLETEAIENELVHNIFSLTKTDLIFAFR